LNKQDLLGDKWTSVFRPDDVGRVYSLFMNSVKTREPFDVEVRVINKKGEIRWIMDSGRPNYSPDGNFMGFIGTMTDITDRKEAMLAIERSEEYFREIVDEAPVMLWMSAPDGKLCFYSKSLLEYLGYKSEEILGFEWINVLHPD